MLNVMSDVVALKIESQVGALSFTFSRTFGTF